MACGDPNSAEELACIPYYLGNVFSAIIPLIGILSFVMILTGGFKILTSAGDAKGMASGRQTITLAIVGIALSILSWLVLVLIRNVTGVNVTEFRFGFN